MKVFLSLVLAVVITVGGFYMYYVAGNTLRASRADALGTQFVAKLYSDYTIMGHSCQGEDTNHDGYVTCNFRLKSPASGDDKVIALQCPTFFKSFMGTSCKEQGLILNSQ